MDSPHRWEELRARLEDIEAFLKTIGYRPPSRDGPPAELIVPHARATADLPVAMPANLLSPTPPFDALAAPTPIAATAASAPPIDSPPPAPRPMPQPSWPPPRATEASRPRVPWPPEAPPHVPTPAPPPLPRRSIASEGVEQAIGLKLAGWIGAIVLVIGAALGVKYAYDQGWLGGLPDEVKLGFLYLVGAGILVLGEVVYRRVDPRAAVGIYAAGVACLFVVSYAGNGYYHLYDQSIAFGLMAGSCAIGAAIAHRGRYVSIAVLSLLGANVAPFILHDRTVGELPTLVYVLTLQVLALILAHVGKGGRWWVLRTLSLVLTNFWIVGRLLETHTAHSSHTLVFACLYFALFQVENTLAARRSGDRAPFSFATFSFATTATLSVELLRWTDEWPALNRAMCLVGLGILCVIAAFTAMGTPNRSLRSLVTSWLTQAGVLLFIALAVALEGPWLTLAWGGLAVGYAILGRAIDRPKTVLAGVLVWCVAIGHLVYLSLAQGRAVHGTWFTVAGVDVTQFLGLSLAVGVLGHVLSMIVSAYPPKEESSRGLFDDSIVRGCRALADAISVGAVALMGIGFHASCEPLNASIGLLVLAWLMVGLWRASDRNVYAMLGVAVAGLTLVKWVVIDLFAERLHHWDPAARALVFNMPMIVGLSALASLVAVAWVTRRIHATSSSSLVWTLLPVGFVAIGIGLSIEVERAVATLANRGPWPDSQLVQFGWTLLWLGIALLFVLTTERLKPGPERQELIRGGAGAIALLLAIKFVVVDSIGATLASPRIHTTGGINAHTIAAVLLLAGLWLAARWNRANPLAKALHAAMVLVPLVVGSIELDRSFGPDRTQVSLSVYWGLYAISLVVAGFLVRSALARFAGLGLLGITLLKIVLVDLANAGQGWRVLSFVGVGIILLATSVLYGKLSPKLLGESPDETPA